MSEIYLAHFDGVATKLVRRVAWQWQIGVRLGPKQRVRRVLEDAAERSNLLYG